jgi:hypothetical protein
MSLIGNINLHTFYFILHSSICTRALLKSLWGGHLGGHFGITFLYSTGGQTLYLKTVFAWAIVQGRFQFACFTCLGIEKSIKRGKWSPKIDENDRNRSKTARIVKNQPRQTRPNSRHSNFEIASSRPHTTSNYTASSRRSRNALLRPPPCTCSESRDRQGRSASLSQK